MRERGVPRESGEALGSWVEYRTKRSKRNPVRHILSHSRGPSDSGENRLGRDETHGLSKVIRRSEGKSVKSFFFRNFPSTCSEPELIAKFREVGPVVDLFCPRKRDVHGKRFGFVRFQLEKEEEEEGGELLEKLNSLWVDSYKLIVLPPRFERRPQLVNKTLPQPKSRPQPIVAAHAEEGRSYANIVKGCRCSCNVKESPTPKVTFIPTDEENEWLEGANVGLLKKEFTWEEFGTDIQDEVASKHKLKPLGENLVLIRNINENGEEGNGASDWAKHWFVWVRPWRPEDVCNRRSVWTSWFGVPLHA